MSKGQNSKKRLKEGTSRKLCKEKKDAKRDKKNEKKNSGILNQ